MLNRSRLNPLVSDLKALYLPNQDPNKLAVTQTGCDEVVQKCMFKKEAKKLQESFNYKTFIYPLILTPIQC